MSHAQRTGTRPDVHLNILPERIVTVLAISPYEEDHIALRSIFSHSNWILRTARTWGEAQAGLAAQAATVVISEASLPDASWKDVLASLESATDKPVLVVTSRLADERLWGEVLNLGGYDVLMKPFDQNEVVRVLGLAWLNWRKARETPERRSPAAMALPKLAAAGA